MLLKDTRAMLEARLERPSQIHAIRPIAGNWCPPTNTQKPKELSDAIKKHSNNLGGHVGNQIYTDPTRRVAANCYTNLCIDCCVAGDFICSRACKRMRSKQLRNHLHWHPLCLCHKDCHKSSNEEIHNSKDTKSVCQGPFN